jgi:hypothetical protein
MKLTILYVLFTLQTLVLCHLFVPVGVHNVQPFINELKLNVYERGFAKTYDCKMEDGPSCGMF